MEEQNDRTVEQQIAEAEEAAAERRKRRKARADQLYLKKLEQQKADDAARDDLELAHDRITEIGIEPYAIGLPTYALVRPMTADELKYFRARTKPKKGRDGEKTEPDFSAIAEEFGRRTMIYPEKDSGLRAELIKSIPGILSRAGNASVALTTGRQVEEGN